MSPNRAAPDVLAHVEGRGVLAGPRKHSTSPLTAHERSVLFERLGALTELHAQLGRTIEDARPLERELLGQIRERVEGFVSRLIERLGIERADKDEPAQQEVA